jgi:hypothetical protein
MKDKMVQAMKVGGLRRLDLWWESLPSMQPISLSVGQAAAKPPQIHLVVMWALRAQLRLLEVWALLLWGQVCRRRSERDAIEIKAKC